MASARTETAKARYATETASFGASLSRLIADGVSFTELLPIPFIKSGSGARKENPPCGAGKGPARRAPVSSGPAVGYLTRADSPHCLKGLAFVQYLQKRSCVVVGYAHDNALTRAYAERMALRNPPDRSIIGATPCLGCGAKRKTTEINGERITVTRHLVGCPVKARMERNAVIRKRRIEEGKM